ncbi:MAG: AcrB/AcrD/AcrF family protein [Acidobacteria bacterium]|nr:AcrB/AcrD/AcrF family protein [Acidobacteriota bacterium]
MSVSEIAIRRPVTVGMSFVAVVLFGLVSLDRLPLNLLPDISYPSLTIQTDYEDAAPEEIESLITRPVEESVGVVSGLTRISSVSRPGRSEVILEFGWGENMDLAAMDVREKLDLIEMPRDVDKPVILRFDPTYDPILRLQLSADVSLSRLRTIAEEDLKKGLEAVEGVAAVKVSGGREEQIRIELDEKRLAELGIPITEVTNVLRQENINQASGSLYDLDANYLVRMLNEFRTVDEMRRIVLRDQQGKPILLGDVAEVWRGVKDRGVITRFNGKESVELAIYKEGDANTVTVSRAVLSRLDTLKKGKTFPKGVETTVVFNQAEFIQASVDNVLSAAQMGGLLAVVILFLFLRDARSTIIIGLSIPLSIMATFALMFQTGVSLNIMSLGGVALGVGMLVDNSIVVLEAVDRYRGRGGRLDRQVAKGTQEVAAAVTGSTLTTIAVFLPLIFVEGIAGQLFRDQALTITFSLLASLAVALTFIPMALALKAGDPSEEEQALYAGRVESRFGGGVVSTIRAAFRFVFVDVARTVTLDIRRALSAAGRAILWILGPLLDGFDALFGSLNNSYPRILRWALDHKGVVGGATLALTALAVSLAGTLGGELIPPLSQGEFSFEVKMPEGTPIDRTDAVIADLEKSAQELPGVGQVFSSVGGSQENQFSDRNLEENFGLLYVVMADKHDHEAEESAIEAIRRSLATYPEAVYSFSRPTLFSFKTPIEVEIFAFDLDDQRTAAAKVAARLTSVEGLSDIRTSTQLGNPEVQIRFDRERLARLGLEENRVAQILRNKIRGDVASRYRDGDRQIDILVRADESDRAALADIGNLVVNTPRSTREIEGQVGSNGENLEDEQNRNPFGGSRTEAQRNAAAAAPIRLAQVADIEVSRGPSEIRRIRSQRAAIVSANLTGRDLSSVSSDIRSALAEIRGELPPNVTVGLSGQNEELETSYRSLLFALALAVFLVYLVMASQFESLTHPFVILFTVPLALVGVVFSLAITGVELSVVVLLGVIILAGIVVNNAIVLIDYANQLRQEGYSKREAILSAGQVRLRPILMTTLTTVLGLLPMALGWGEGAEIRAPMAIAVMGGLSFSTVLTLVLIPAVYELVDRKAYEPAAEEHVYQGAD